MPLIFYGRVPTTLVDSTQLRRLVKLLILRRALIMSVFEIVLLVLAGFAVGGMSDLAGGGTISSFPAPFATLLLYLLLTATELFTARP